MVLASARSGADVVIASRKFDVCEELAAEVDRSTGRKATALALPVGRWNDLAQCTDTVCERCGHVDVLVNNAGVAPSYPNRVELSEALFDEVIGVSLKGPSDLSSFATGATIRIDGGVSIA